MSADLPRASAPRNRPRLGAPDRGADGETGPVQGVVAVYILPS